MRNTRWLLILSATAACRPVAPGSAEPGQPEASTPRAAQAGGPTPATAYDGSPGRPATADQSARIAEALRAHRGLEVAIERSLVVTFDARTLAYVLYSVALGDACAAPKAELARTCESWDGNPELTSEEGLDVVEAAQQSLRSYRVAMLELHAGQPSIAAVVAEDPLGDGTRLHALVEFAWRDADGDARPELAVEFVQWGDPDYVMEVDPPAVEWSVHRFVGIYTPKLRSELLFELWESRVDGEGAYEDACERIVFDGDGRVVFERYDSMQMFLWCAYQRPWPDDLVAWVDQSYAHSDDPEYDCQNGEEPIGTLTTIRYVYDEEDDAWVQSGPPVKSRPTKICADYVGDP